MKIAITGGGPGGLYAAILFSRLGHEVELWERNAPDDTFGFGIVFSDETLAAFEAADPATYAEITASFVHWTDIDVFYRGRRERSGGHGFSALSRQRLLNILRRRATELGASLQFETEAPCPLPGHDLAIAADGANSRLRDEGGDVFGTSIDVRRSKYMWLASDLVFDAFTFHVVETEFGTFQIHGYPYAQARSTFIVETDEATWRRAGLDRSEGLELPPGVSDEGGIEFCRRQFADLLGEQALFANNSKWLSFRTIRNGRWHDGRTVLLGDAAHTAHFSIGSGTKLAMEDAIALAWAFKANPDREVPEVLAAYEGERRPIVESTQRAAQASLEWFEGIERYVGQSPSQFAFNLITRSRRITYDNLRLRDAGFVDEIDTEFAAAAAGAELAGDDTETPAPMFLPLRLRELELANRVVVAPMDMYSAVDGRVGDFHLVHLGSRGIGGAGLVMSEMICVSAEGRITPGCAGLYRDDQVEGWRRIVDFVHRHSSARIGAQLGHSGRKGSTKLLWEGDSRPLEQGGWETIAPSPIPYFSDSPAPREITPAEMAAVLDQFVSATARAERAGFDLLEIHFAHGYLLSSFLSPLTNRRTDEYGGSLANRARFPLAVLDACRAAWPQEKPLSVRISASDWVEGGFEGDQAVELAALLRDHDVDIVHVSSGQVSPDQKPEYGRSFQTPFADRIRHEAGIPTIAVGAISSAEDVNTTILSGRADLCALGRPHLFDPHWTLHAAADLDYRGVAWIDQYRSGRRRPNDGTQGPPKPPPRRFERDEEVGGEHGRAHLQLS